MSAPRTPAEMADWLEEMAERESWLWAVSGDEANSFGLILDTLRSVPTDAQKIEALMEAADAGDVGGYACLKWERQSRFKSPEEEEVEHVRSLSIFAAKRARKAMRLLGLPTGDEPR